MSFLCLGRKVGESIMITVDDKVELEIKVTRTERGQVVIGIDADKNKYRIVRKELMASEQHQRSR